MALHLLPSWEIMPQTLWVCVGDVHIDGTLIAIILVAWLIRTR